MTPAPQQPAPDDADQPQADAQDSQMDAQSVTITALPDGTFSVSQGDDADAATPVRTVREACALVEQMLGSSGAWDAEAATRDATGQRTQATGPPMSM